VAPWGSPAIPLNPVDCTLLVEKPTRRAHCHCRPSSWPEDVPLCRTGLLQEGVTHRNVSREGTRSPSWPEPFTATPVIPCVFEPRKVFVQVALSVLGSSLAMKIAELLGSLGDTVATGPLPRFRCIEEGADRKDLFRQAFAPGRCCSSVRSRSRRVAREGGGNTDPSQMPVVGSQAAKLGQKGVPWHTPLEH